MPLGRRRRGRRTPTRRSRPSPRSSTPPSADEESSDGAPSESDGDDEEGTAPTGRHRAGGELLRLLVLAGAALVVAVLLVQGLKGSGGRRTTRRSRRSPGRGARSTAARAQMKNGGGGARAAASDTVNTASFCRSGVHRRSLRRRTEMFFETSVPAPQPRAATTKQTPRIGQNCRFDRSFNNMVRPVTSRVLCFTLGALFMLERLLGFLTVPSASKVECALQVGSLPADQALSPLDQSLFLATTKITSADGAIASRIRWRRRRLAKWCR